MSNGTNPLATNSATFSRAVTAVVTASVTAIVHDSRSRADSHDGRADAVEHRLHPAKTVESDIRRGQRPDHQERRKNEGGTRNRRADDAAAHVAEVHRELRGERSRSELREGEALDVIVA